MLKAGQSQKSHQPRDDQFDKAKLKIGLGTKEQTVLLCDDATLICRIPESILFPHEIRSHKTVSGREAPAQSMCIVS